MTSFRRPLRTARPFEDYAVRFDLTETELSRGPVLDCPSGGSGLLVELARRGTPAIGVDPLFAGGRARAVRGLAEDGAHCLEQGFQDYGPADAARMRAALDEVTRVLDERRPDPMVLAAALPGLPFPDAAFALVLSGHLLFTYRELFTPEDHVRCLRELLRVAAGPVRVFPVATASPADPALDPNGPYPHLGDVLAELRVDGCRTELRTPASGDLARLGWQLLELRNPGSAPLG